MGGGIGAAPIVAGKSRNMPQCLPPHKTKLNKPDQIDVANLNFNRPLSGSLSVHEINQSCNADCCAASFKCLNPNSLLHQPGHLHCSNDSDGQLNRTALTLQSQAAFAGVTIPDVPF